MKRYAFALVALLSLASEGAFAQPSAAAQAPAPAPGCVNAGLPVPVQRVVGGKIVFVRPLATVLDAAVDDFGQSGNDDALSVYCVSKTPNALQGTIAMCLTGEACPWR